MTNKEFTKRLFSLASLVDYEMTQTKADAYWDIFKGYPDEELIRALNLSLKTNKFFPKPAELIELIEGSPSDKSLQAWQSALDTISKVGIYGSPQFEDRRITAVIMDMGSWEIFCNMFIKDQPFRQKEFRERYNYYLKHPIPTDTPNLLTGLIGIANGEKYKEFTPKPVKISKKIEKQKMLGKKLDKR